MFKNLQRERAIKQKNLFYTRRKRRNKWNERESQCYPINEFHLFVPSREKGNEEIFRWTLGDNGTEEVRACFETVCVIHVSRTHLSIDFRKEISQKFHRPGKTIRRQYQQSCDSRYTAVSGQLVHLFSTTKTFVNESPNRVEWKKDARGGGRFEKMEDRTRSFSLSSPSNFKPS